MKAFCCLIALGLALVSDLAQAMAKPKITIHQMGPGRVIFTETLLPAKASNPTLLLLPGIWRSYHGADEFIALLKARGLGVVTMHFSMQAPSLSVLKDGEVPYFRNHQITLQSLADEVEFIAAGLRKGRRTKNLVAVSLSYSAIITPLLKSFPYIIETSPMTSGDAAKPEVTDYRRWLDRNLNLMPISRRLMIDQMYHHSASEPTDDIIRSFGLEKKRRSDMIAGYALLMRLAEGATLSDFDTPVKRAFVIAENETSLLKAHQLWMIEEARMKQRRLKVVEIKDAVHIIAYDKPNEFAKALIKLTANCESLLSTWDKP